MGLIVKYEVNSLIAIVDTVFAINSRIKCTQISRPSQKQSQHDFGPEKENKMKILAKLIVIIFMLAICLPAEGEILIYSKISDGFEAGGVETSYSIESIFTEFEWNAGERTYRGYLLLDVEFNSDNQLAAINRAAQFDYWKDGENRYYEQRQLDFNVERIQVDEQVFWTLTDINTPQDDQVEIFMVSGSAGLNNIAMISSPNNKEIPLLLKGTYLEYLQNTDTSPAYIEKKIYSVTLRLNSWWTRVAQVYYQDYIKENGENFTQDPFTWAEGGVDKNGNSYGIIKDWLLRNEYTEVSLLD